MRLLNKDKGHYFLKYKVINTLYAFFLLSISIMLAVREYRHHFYGYGLDLTPIQETWIHILWLLVVLAIPITGLFMKNIKAKIYIKALLIIVPSLVSTLLFNYTAVTDMAILYSAVILTVLGHYRFAQLFLVAVYLSEIYFLIYKGILPPPLEWAFNPENNILFYLGNIAVRQIPDFIVRTFVAPLLLASSLILALKIFFKKIEENFIDLESDTGRVLEEARKDFHTGFKLRDALDDIYSDLKLNAKNENLDLIFLLHSIENISSINNIHGYEAGNLCVRDCAAELSIEVGWQTRFFSLGGSTPIIISVHMVEKDSAGFKEFIKKIGLQKFFQYNDIRISYQIATGAYISKSDEPLSMIIAKADAARINASKDNQEHFNEVTGVHNFGSSLQENTYKDVEGATSIEDIRGEYDLQLIKDAILNNEITVHGEPIIDVSSRTLVGIQATPAWIDNTGDKARHETYLRSLSQIQWKEPYFEIIAKENRKFIIECSKVFDDIPIFFTINPFYASSLFDPASRVFEVLNDLSASNFENAVIQIPYFLTPTFSERLNVTSQGEIRLALDNFGSMESFQALKDHKFHFIKLAPQFYQDIHISTEVQDLAKAMVGFCQKLDIEIIAQGVADKKSAKTLESIGITNQQGPFWSADISIVELKTLNRSLEQLFDYSN